MKKSLIIISLLISGIFAEDYAGLSGSFMRLGITARSIAMGGAFTAETVSYTHLTLPTTTIV